MSKQLSSVDSAVCDGVVQEAGDLDLFDLSDTVVPGGFVPSHVCSEHTRDGECAVCVYWGITP